VPSTPPDRRLAILFVGVESTMPDEVDNVAVPIAGGPARHICRVCSTAWSPDGKYFYVAFDLLSRMNPSGSTLAIPVPPGETLPPLPAGGILTEAEGLAIPGARIIDQGDIIARPDPSTYAYVKSARCTPICFASSSDNRDAKQAPMAPCPERKEQATLVARRHVRGQEQSWGAWTSTTIHTFAGTPNDAAIPFLA